MANTHTRTHNHTHTHIPIHTLNPFIHTLTCIFTHWYTLIYIHMLIHSFTQIHTHHTHSPIDNNTLTYINTIHPRTLTY